VPDYRWHVYTLADPRTGEVRYVGETRGFRNRQGMHLSTPRRARLVGRRLMPLEAWVLELLDAGLAPAMTSLAAFDDYPPQGDRREIEGLCIERHAARGARLFNVRLMPRGVAHGAAEGSRPLLPVQMATRSAART
jgi:hypothetical protein